MFKSFRKYRSRIYRSKFTPEKLRGIRTKVIIRNTVVREMKNLEVVLSKDPNSIVRIVYDMQCASPGYGEFAQVAMLARLLSSQGHNVEFLLIDSNERRTDWWQFMNEGEHRTLFLELIELGCSLLPTHVSVRHVCVEGRRLNR